MAATLAHIKSKMLLPRAPERAAGRATRRSRAGSAARADPPVARVPKVQAVGRASGCPRGRRPRRVPARHAGIEELQGPAPLAEIGLFKLLDAFQAILGRAKDRHGARGHAPSASRSRSASRRSPSCCASARRASFEELFEGDITRYEIVVTFLALLEMTKMRVTRIYQPDYRRRRSTCSTRCSTPTRRRFRLRTRADSLRRRPRTIPRCPKNRSSHERRGLRRKKPVRGNKRGPAVATAEPVADESEDAPGAESGDEAIVTSERPTADPEQPQNGVHIGDDDPPEGAAYADAGRSRGGRGRGR